MRSLTELNKLRNEASTKNKEIFVQKHSALIKRAEEAYIHDTLLEVPYTDTAREAFIFLFNKYHTLQIGLNHIAPGDSYIYKIF